MSDKRTNALQEEASPALTDNLLIDRPAYVEAKRVKVQTLVNVIVSAVSTIYVTQIVYNGFVSAVNTRFTNDEAAISQNAAAIATNITDIATLQDGLADEVAARIAADTALDAAKQDVIPYTPEDAANKNQPSGYAGLDGAGKVPAGLLPAYVDDVIEVANYAALPVTGESGKIYVTINTNLQYRWSGSAYIRLVPSPGSTDDVPEGSLNLYFTVARVLATVLTGISFVTGSAVVSTDTILVALGKLQKQVTNALAGILPAGGTTGQLLQKVNATDYNTSWVDGSAIKSYQLMMAPFGVNEVPFYFLNAGNITAGSITGASGLKLKIGAAGTYPVGAQTYPFTYAAGDRVWATYNYTDLLAASCNIILTCKDN